MGSPRAKALLLSVSFAGAMALGELSLKVLSGEVVVLDWRTALALGVGLALRAMLKRSLALMVKLNAEAEAEDKGA